MKLNEVIYLMEIVRHVLYIIETLRRGTFEKFYLTETLRETWNTMKIFHLMETVRGKWNI